jgi:hypothetical protein
LCGVLIRVWLLDFYLPKMSDGEECIVIDSESESDSEPELPLGISELIQAINKLGGVPKHSVCYQCNSIVKNVTWLYIDKHGYQRPFCENDTLYCEFCDENYCQLMDHDHDDCSFESGIDDDIDSDGDGDGDESIVDLESE